MWNRRSASLTVMVQQVNFTGLRPSFSGLLVEVLFLSCETASTRVVDKTMLKFHGRFVGKQYMAKKPTKWEKSAASLHWRWDTAQSSQPALKPFLFTHRYYTYIPLLTSFPGPAQLFVAWIRKSGRGSGIFCHVSDVRVEEGREDLIERRRIIVA